jgi:hypothetical protein
MKEKSKFIEIKNIISCKYKKIISISASKTVEDLAMSAKKQVLAEKKAPPRTPVQRLRQLPKTPQTEELRRHRPFDTPIGRGIPFRFDQLNETPTSYGKRIEAEDLFRDNLFTDMGHIVDGIESEMKRLDEKISSLELRIRQIEKSQATVGEQRESALFQVETLRRSLEKEQVANSALKEDLKEITTLRDEIRELSETVASKNLALQELTSERDEAQEKILENQTAFDEAQSELEATHSSALSDLNDEHQATALLLKEKTSAHDTTLHDLETLTAQKGDSDTSVLSLRRELAQLGKEKGELITSHNEQELEISATKAFNAEQLDAFGKQFLLQQREQQALLQEKELELTEADKLCRLAIEARNSKARDIKILTRRLSQKDAEIAEKVDALVLAEGRHSDLEARFKDLEQQLSLLKTRLSGVVSSRTELELEPQLPTVSLSTLESAPDVRSSSHRQTSSGLFSPSDRGRGSRGGRGGRGGRGRGRGK